MDSGWWCGKEGEMRLSVVSDIDTSLILPSNWLGQAPSTCSATVRGLSVPSCSFQQDQWFWAVSWINCYKVIQPHHPWLCDIRQIP